MKANITMKGQAVPNHRRRKGKKVKSNTDSAAHKLLINKDNYMTGITTYLSILTLNVNELNSPIRRQSGLKRKIQQSAAYRRPTS
jgi:hypothetical protein